MTTITRAGAEAIDRLRPLWLELHHHHQAVGGDALGPYVDDATSWRECRAMFEGYLARVGFALLAERDGELVGAVVSNVDAIRLYERRGFRPAWLYMFRLGGRSA